MVSRRNHILRNSRTQPCRQPWFKSRAEKMAPNFLSQFITSKRLGLELKNLKIYWSRRHSLAKPSRDSNLIDQEDKWFHKHFPLKHLFLAQTCRLGATSLVCVCVVGDLRVLKLWHGKFSILLITLVAPIHEWLMKQSREKFWCVLIQFCKFETNK